MNASNTFKSSNIMFITFYLSHMQHLKYNIRQVGYHVNYFIMVVLPLATKFIPWKLYIYMYLCIYF